MDQDEEDLTKLWGKNTVAKERRGGRRARELQVLSAGGRRAMRGGEKKDAQLNLKIRPSLKAAIVAAAIAERLSLAEYLEKLHNEHVAAQSQ